MVEEVIGDRGQKFRRLIFLNHRTAIQSEVKIVSGAVSKAINSFPQKVLIIFKDFSLQYTPCYIPVSF